MQKILTIALIIVATAIFTVSAEARSGRCSHHSGVCGCGCCDGTPLSATCAPYYPECSPSVPKTIQLKPINYSQTIISDKDQIESNLIISKSNYQKNPAGFREKKITELIQNFPTVLTETIGYYVYTILPDVKKLNQNDDICVGARCVEQMR